MFWSRTVPRCDRPRSPQKLYKATMKYVPSGIAPIVLIMQLVCVTVFGQPVAPAGADLNFAYLAKYQGQPLVALLAEPVVADALGRTLGRERMSALLFGSGSATQFTVTGSTGRHLVVTGYRAGSGFANGATMLVSFSDGAVFVCLSENDQDRWLASGAPPLLLSRDACIDDPASLMAKFGP